MKKSIFVGIASFAVAGACSFGQGFIALDNYNSSVHPLVTYGAGFGAQTGMGLRDDWTAGIYFAQGNVLASINPDPTGVADPSTLGGGLVVGTGPGSTTIIFRSIFNTPGQFGSANTFLASPTAGATITAMVVAYNGSDYNSSLIRGHSAAFTMMTVAGNAPTPSYIGDAMPTFSVNIIPEPSMFALSGLGAAALMLRRRKK